MRQGVRTTIAFLLAPIAPCVAYGLWPAAVAGRASEALVFVVPAITVCLAVTLVFCVPAYLLLRRYWKVGFVECVASGAVAAVLLNVVLYVASRVAFSEGGYSAADSGGATYIDSTLTAHGWAVALQGVLYNMFLGASIGASFWLLAFWRAPASNPTEQGPARVA